MGQDGNEDEGTALRANYAGVGYITTGTMMSYAPPKPYASWLLDGTTYLWGAPVALSLVMEKFICGNEDSTNWVEL